METPETVSARVLTVPNVISFIRLALIPVFVWAFLTGRDFTAFMLVFFIGISDFIDGFIARRFGQVSVLGKVLDPLSDRVAIFAAMAALAFRGTIPFGLAAAIMARDLIVALVFPVLEKKGYPRVPVNSVGKLATMAIFLGMGFAIMSVVLPNSFEAAAHAAAIALLALGAVLYWVAGGFYYVEIRRLVRARAP